MNKHYEYIFYKIHFYLQEELNVLNQTSADINKLENELDVS